MSRKSELKEFLHTDPDFLSNVITDNRSWVYEYDPLILSANHLSGRAHLHNGHRKPIKSRITSNVYLISFFKTDEIIHNEFILPGQSVTREFYHDILW